MTNFKIITDRLLSIETDLYNTLNDLEKLDVYTKKSEYGNIDSVDDKFTESEETLVSAYDSVLQLRWLIEDIDLEDYK